MGEALTRAPAERTTPDALGRAFVAAKKSVPALTVVAPVYVLIPVSASRPGPDLVNPPVPATAFVITTS